MPNAKRRVDRYATPRGRRQAVAPDWAQGLEWQGSEADQPSEPTWLHSQRLETVQQALRNAGVRSVADLGCGDGALVRRLLADPHNERVVAIDRDPARLAQLERSVEPAWLRSGRLVLVHGSFAAPHDQLAGVEAVSMVETIEHLAPAELSALEHRVFTVVHPAFVAITTPNVECNGLLGMAPGQLREPGHHFEWPRSRFRAWACGVAARRGYTVRIAGIGPEDAEAGCPTQWAWFERRDALSPISPPTEAAGLPAR